MTLSRAAVLVLSIALTACAPQDESFLTADAGPARSGQLDQSYVFDGSASLASSWSWRLVQTPSGSRLEEGDLQDADTPWPVLTPDIEGVYVLELTACDSQGVCAWTETEAYVGPVGIAQLITPRPLLKPRGLGVYEDTDPVDFKGRQWGARPNKPPVAIVTARQGLRADSAVYLPGDESYDPDGDTLSYRWSFASMPADSALDSTAISNSTGSSARFTPDVAGIWQVRLTVRDAWLRDTETIVLESQEDTERLD